MKFVSVSVLVVASIAWTGCASDEAARRPDSSGKSLNAETEIGDAGNDATDPSGVEATAVEPTGVESTAVEPTGARLFLWKISKAGEPGEVFLLGSVHVQRSVHGDLDPSILEVISEADELVFEIDTAALEASEIQRLTLHYGVYAPGETIWQHLRPDTKALLEKTLTETALPAALIERMKPWLAALTLTTLQMRREGYSQEAGIEALVRTAADAQTRKTKRSSLETVDFQLKLFADLTPLVQDALLQETCASFTEQPALFAALEKAYRSGDEEALLELLQTGRETADRDTADQGPIEVRATDDASPAPLSGEAESAKPAKKEEQAAAMESFFRRLIDDRNFTMSNEVKKFVTLDQRTLVTVGAAHVVGARGIVSLLIADGYDVERQPGRSAARDQTGVHSTSTSTSTSTSAFAFDASNPREIKHDSLQPPWIALRQNVVKHRLVAGSSIVGSGTIAIDR